MSADAAHGRLAGKRAVITGGASGIGAACARLFGAEGAAVVIADLDAARAKGEELAGALPAGVFVGCDVRVEEEVEEVFEECSGRFGGIDIVVASAGVGHHPDQPRASEPLTAELLATELEHWRFVLDVNLLGVFLTARGAARRMLASGTPGSIVTLASIAAKRPSKGVYSVSKAGVWMLTRCLAEELGPHGIRVNALGPGIIRTPLTSAGAEEAGTSVEEYWGRQIGSLPLRRIGEPDDVARAALFLCSDEAAYITGSILHPDGGMASTIGGG